jgi:hypothetical protein
MNAIRRHTLVAVAALCVSCAMVDDSPMEIEHQNKLLEKLNLRTLYWDCHGSTSSLSFEDIPSLQDRKVGIWSCWCRVSLPDCSGGGRFETTAPTNVLAYTHKQAAECGEKQCKNWATGQAPLMSYVAFGCEPVAERWIDEPDHWWSIIPFVGDKPVQKVTPGLCGGWRLF